MNRGAAPAATYKNIQKKPSGKIPDGAYSYKCVGAFSIDPTACRGGVGQPYSRLFLLYIDAIDVGVGFGDFFEGFGYLLGMFIF